MNVLIVEALDGADVGPDDGDLGGSVRGALPQQRLPRAVVVVPQQRLRRRVRAAPCGVRALDVVVEAAAPLRLRRRRLVGGRQVVAVHYCVGGGVAEAASVTLPSPAPLAALREVQRKPKWSGNKLDEKKKMGNGTMLNCLSTDYP
jgi:hypothetical protein